MVRISSLAVALALVLLPSLAYAQQAACTPPLEKMLRVELFFGRSVAGRRPVTDREWAQFLTHELTPRFPGLTVLDGRGAWRHDGHEVREPSKLVVVVLPDTVAARGEVAATADAYKHRFHQQSVGIVMQDVCAAF